MRAAETIMLEYVGLNNMNALVIRAINEARKEAIEECAERAKSEWIRYGTNMGHAVEKQSILSLINELK